MSELKPGEQRDSQVTPHSASPFLRFASFSSLSPSLFVFLSLVVIGLQSTGESSMAHAHAREIEEAEQPSKRHKGDGEGGAAAASSSKPERQLPSLYKVTSAHACTEEVGE